MFYNDELADWAERAQQLGAKYWYGTCWYKATEPLLIRKAQQYPQHYASGRMSTYRSHIAQGRMVCDCVGLIKGFFWTGNGVHANRYKANNCPDRSANGMLSLCEETGTLDTMPDVRGLVVWQSGHIGIYVGGGKVVEARGFKYGVVKTDLHSRGWKKWGRLPASMITYRPSGVQEPSSKPDESAASARKTLRQGMNGPEVKALQELLAAAGCTLPKYGADGDFGAETLAAVKAFQKAHGLEVDGIVGSKTWAALEMAAKSAGDAASVRQTLSQGMKGAEVKALQEALAAAGYALPKYGADGDFGAETLAAVKAFQKDCGLEADGVVGPKTWAALIAGRT